MNLTNKISNELKQLIGFSGTQPQTVSFSGPEGIVFAIDFTAVDSMSCSFREVRLRVPSLADSGFDVLKEWAEALCQRVTYLLEKMGPLELDPDSDEVLIRSMPPDQQEDGTRFYEVMLYAQANGNFTLRRFQAEKGRPGRDQVDIQLTHEVLQKLLNDLVETIPDEGRSS